MPFANHKVSYVAFAASLILSLLVAPGGIPAAQSQPDVRLDNHRFDWLDASGDTATFEWAIDVINETDRAYEVRVILELLDDDDRVVNRDDQGAPLDVVVITLQPDESRRITQQGQMPYELAAEVVSLRHRRELSEPSY